MYTDARELVSLSRASPTVSPTWFRVFWFFFKIEALKTTTSRRPRRTSPPVLSAGHCRSCQLVCCGVLAPLCVRFAAVSHGSLRFCPKSIYRLCHSLVPHSRPIPPLPRPPLFESHSDKRHGESRDEFPARGRAARVIRRQIRRFLKASLASRSRLAIFTLTSPHRRRRHVPFPLQHVFEGNGPHFARGRT